MRLGMRLAWSWCFWSLRPGRSAYHSCSSMNAWCEEYSRFFAKVQHLRTRHLRHSCLIPNICVTEVSLTKSEHLQTR